MFAPGLAAGAAIFVLACRASIREEGASTNPSALFGRILSE